MHHLPAGWHRLESWLTLIWEILIPFLIFGPRSARLAAACVFTLFQMINTLTANYGFFCYLAFCLGIFLLTDRDVLPLLSSIRRRFTGWRRHWTDRGYAVRRGVARLRLFQRARRRWLVRFTLPISSARPALSIARRIGAALAVTCYIGVSLDGGITSFWPEKAPAGSFFEEARTLYSPFRAINTYHLFGHITTKRIEPEFQLYYAGDFHPLTFRYKPGPVDRAPPFVAPHQPRVDFQLWFYGLSYRQSTPSYVVALIQRLCHDPRAVESLFATRLPPHPEAARIAFYEYKFTSFDEWRQSGAWWKRTPLDQRTVSCDRLH
jgi:hypothetical protein